MHRTARVPKRNSSAPASQGETVVERVKTIFCVGLVILGLLLTIPWWGLIGWMAMRLARYL